ncbi:asparagine synthase-related protein [Nocardiopsis halophila]|uniref:asparagine synthase-related protein n=1 Tax=Nocardiopsis halophila TaxID=141692 RepID=UPI00034D2331|nr:asparagine synthase-related protein [Nocardiopsis halophila]
MPLAVLPDAPVRGRVLAHLRQTLGPVRHEHRSGRPWILGGSASGALPRARTGDIDIVVSGHAGVDSKGLLEKVRNITSMTRTEELAKDIAEFDVLVFAHDGDRLRAYAPPFQTRSLFWTVYDGVTVVSDEQYPLAELNGFALDHGVLASRLVNVEVSHPFTRRPIWKGVDGLGVGEHLTVSADAAPERRRWWSPPRADRPIGDLAKELRANIEEALALRTNGRRVFSTDLSGGLDSTTLGFFAAHLTDDLHTLFFQAENGSNRDGIWAGRAAREIGSEHTAVPYRSVLEHIAHEVAPSLSTFPEGPGTLSTAIASASGVERHISGTGSTLHLNGNAGDALFGQVSSMVWSFFRSGQRGRCTWLRRYRRMNRIPVSAMLRMLSDRRTYIHELDRIARGDYRRPAHDAADHASWIQVPRFPDVFTAEAQEQVSGLARAELDDGSVELSPDRTLHQILSYLAVHGAANRRMNHVAEAVRFDAPYLDRRVVETALALDHGDRARQSPAKPLLAAARPPTMSIDYFLRRDKGDYTAEVFQHHKTIRDRARSTFAEGSVLGDLGLIREERAVGLADTYSADGLAHSDLVELEFAERWLRSVHSARADASAGGIRPCSG